MTEQEIHANYRGTDVALALITFLMNAALVIAPGFLGGLAIFFAAQASFH